jgi:hypothetical protein
MYIPIRNPQGDGVDISSFSGKEPGGRRNLSRNIGKIKHKDSTRRSQKGKWHVSPF